MEAVKNVVEAAATSLAHVGEALGIPNLDPTSGLIFVTGGTGPVGHRIALRLADAGYVKVRIGVHHPDANEDLAKLGVDVATFDWKDEDTYAPALAGVKSVMCTAPYVANWQQRFPAFLRACHQAGVKHIVKLSFYHARSSGDVFQDVPLVRAHGDCDELLANSGIAYTILAATHFMSNPFVFQGENLRADQKPATLFGASGEKGINYVSPNDVAEISVHALMEPKPHYNKEYTITGPEAIKDQAVAGYLSKYLNKPIMYVDQPLHTFEDQEKAAGDPEWLIKDLVALEKIKASGAEEDASFVSKDFETICGHPAEKYEDYLSNTRTMTKIETA